jgi:hypothetical protein
MAKEGKEFGDIVREGMTVDSGNALERNFELAKKMIMLTPEGKVILAHHNKLGGEDKIVLYLVGKVYAKVAGYTNEIEVPNKELLDELGMKEGSLAPWLKFLRDKGQIKQTVKNNLSYHFVPNNLIESELKRIWDKVGDKAETNK